MTTTRHGVPALFALAGAVGLLFHAQPGGSASLLSTRVGIVSLRPNACYLAIDSSTAQPGTDVTAIDPGAPEARFTVRISRRIDNGKWPDQPLVSLPDDRRPALYEVACPENPPEVPFVAIGLVGFKGTVRRQANGIAGDFDGSSKDLFAYRCSGSEDLHFIVRSAPKGKLLWRAAYYLGYDVESTCSPDDLK